MGRTTVVLTATSCGFVLGSALTYFLYGRRKDDEGRRSRSIPGLRGTGRSTPRSARSVGTEGGGTSITKRSAYALAKLAQHGLDIEAQEHIGFLSSIMRELWPYVDKAGSEMVKDMMEPMFAEMLPGPLKSLKFIKLGECLFIMWRAFCFFLHNSYLRILSHTSLCQFNCSIHHQ